MIRKAKISDAKQLYALINSWAKKGKVLERSLNYLYEAIRDFWVYEDKRKIVGCCALHVVGWQDLGEIKSLVVAKKYQGRGIGKQLVEKCLQEARSLGIKNIFALTFVTSFFKKLGFKAINRKDLPHKIWSDCVNCVYFPDCHEEALIFKLNKAQ
jgi:amino-acid N-acetyltransferase